MSTQTQRERFEAWAATHDLDLTPGLPGQYSDCNTDYAWIAAQHFEAAAIERCAKALYDHLMGGDIGFAEAHLTLNVGGVPPSEEEFVVAIRALLKTDGGEG